MFGTRKPRRFVIKCKPNVNVVYHVDLFIINSYLFFLPYFC